MLENKNILTPKDIKVFRKKIYDFYHTNGRSFSWRQNISPYRVVVSEIMLQQTQTNRVTKKFDIFIKKFPNFQALANASFEDVLREWKGLGYNRRAQALQKIAHLVMQQHNGILPNDSTTLRSLPGIGQATAASITTFAFNKPTTFIETNIRTVFIYFFFKNSAKVSDKELFPLVEQTVDSTNPREWYYALMDYGVMLKKTYGNFSRLSSQYAKQSQFQGSNRQIRGMILQQLLEKKQITEQELIALLARDLTRTKKIVHDLEKEGFVQRNSHGLLKITIK